MKKQTGEIEELKRQASDERFYADIDRVNARLRMDDMRDALAALHQGKQGRAVEILERAVQIVDHESVVDFFDLHCDVYRAPIDGEKI